jgi:hypothetical protein
VPLGWCVVAEAGYNWYLLILIYSLYRKIILGSQHLVKYGNDTYFLEDSTNHVYTKERAHSWTTVIICSLYYLSAGSSVGLWAIMLVERMQSSDHEKTHNIHLHAERFLSCQNAEKKDA